MYVSEMSNISSSELGSSFFVDFEAFDIYFTTFNLTYFLAYKLRNVGHILDNTFLFWITVGRVKWTFSNFFAIYLCTEPKILPQRGSTFTVLYLTIMFSRKPVISKIVCASFFPWLEIGFQLRNFTIRFNIYWSDKCYR